MKIAVDAFGSDKAPFPEVEGAIMAIRDNICEEVILVGDRDRLQTELSRFYFPKGRIQIEHATQVVRMDDKASMAAKSRKDSSLHKAVSLHKSGMAQAVVSAGNTGAMMADSMFTLGRIKGVARPAISIVLPTMKKPTIILDVGANVDCTPEHLLQFAEIGSLYSQFFFGIDRPRVALLNIGEESVKGNSLTKQAHALLLDQEALNFTGNIEGKHLLDGDMDVIVCDGFVGNIMLKTIEGVAMSIFRMMKQQIRKDWIAKIGAVLTLPVFTYLKKKMDHTEYGGALLVGLNGYPVISHGSSNAKAIKNAIRFAVDIAQSRFIEHTRLYFERKEAS